MTLLFVNRVTVSISLFANCVTLPSFLSGLCFQEKEMNPSFLRNVGQFDLRIKHLGKNSQKM